MAVIDRLSWARTAGARLTTPLHPDDYLSLVNPLWTARELRGRVEKVVPETEDAATLVIRPGWGWRYDHQPGQYVGIGVQVDGQVPVALLLGELAARSATVAPSRSPCGRCPRGCSPRTWSTASSPAPSCGSRCPRATSCCPTRRRHEMLFLVGGSGDHPGDVDAAHPRPPRHDARRRRALLLADRGADDLPRRARRARASSTRASPLHRLHTDTDGMLDLADLDTICPDWRERETWACGPAPMLDAITRALGGRRPRGPAAPRALLPRAAAATAARAAPSPSSNSGKDDRGRRRHHRARGRRGGRRRDALRLPDGHLPHLHAHARHRHRARPAQRRRVRPAQRAGADLRHRRVGDCTLDI